MSGTNPNQNVQSGAANAAALPKTQPLGTSNATASLPNQVATSAAPLPPTTMRLLQDKFYEKRKQAALEIEKTIKESLAQNDTAKIRRIVECLIQDFAYSSQSNARNGGLIGLAAVAIALGSKINLYLKEMVPPVLACLQDQDARVRYYACESMYNMCKVARQEALIFFNELFDALSKLAADPELSVKNGADLLDRLIKDVVSEQVPPPADDDHIPPLVPNDGQSMSPITKATVVDPLHHAHSTFSLPKFIPLLSERIYTVNPFTRSFLISWLHILDSVPHLELLSYLGDFLDGLVGFVGDENEDVRVGAMNLLGEFLKELKQLEYQKLGITTGNEFGESGAVDDDTVVEETGSKAHRAITIPYRRLITILLPHTRSFAHEPTQLIALTWISELVLLFLMAAENEVDAPGNHYLVDLNLLDIIRVVPEVVSAVLPCLAHVSPSIRRIAEKCDIALRQMVTVYLDRQKNLGAGSDADHFDFLPMVNALTLQFLNENEKTRVASLEWLIMLHQKAPTEIMSAESGTFPALLKTLSDPSEAVVKRDLQLLAQISSAPQDQGDNADGESYFAKFISSLLSLFSTDRRLLEQRGSLIVRQLALHLDAEAIYRVFSGELLSQTQTQQDGDISTSSADLDFARLMVQQLNLILMTAPELADVRRQLKRCFDSGSSIQQQSPDSLFIALYKSWCHDTVAVLSLCLLAQAYEHACALLQTFSELEMTVSFLVQLDKLVQLLESPVFTYLRLQLLEPEKQPHLYKCLYGILMLLPQSSAFATLRNRLNSVHHLASVTQHVSSTGSGKSPHSSRRGDQNPNQEMLSHFLNVQNRHLKHKKGRGGAGVNELTLSDLNMGSSGGFLGRGVSVSSGGLMKKNRRPESNVPRSSQTYKPASSPRSSSNMQAKSRSKTSPRPTTSSSSGKQSASKSQSTATTGRQHLSSTTSADSDSDQFIHSFPKPNVSSGQSLSSAILNVLSSGSQDEPTKK